MSIRADRREHFSWTDANVGALRRVRPRGEFFVVETFAGDTISVHLTRAEALKALNA